MLRFAPLALVHLLTACGPSESEIRVIKAQALLEEKALKAAEQTFHQETEALARAKADYVVFQDRLARAHEFKIGRSIAKREADIREATMRLEELRIYIEKQALVVASAEMALNMHKADAPMAASLE